MIFLLRSMTKSFLLKHKERSLNELPLEAAPSTVDNCESLQEYVDKIVMKMG